MEIRVIGNLPLEPAGLLFYLWFLLWNEIGIWIDSKPTIRACWPAPTLFETISKKSSGCACGWSHLIFDFDNFSDCPKTLGVCIEGLACACWGSHLIIDSDNFSPLNIKKLFKVWNENFKALLLSPTAAFFIHLGYIEKLSQKMQIWWSQKHQFLCFHNNFKAH